ncbi:MAG: sel1 repeat family protein, partial [Opitutales bacterium]|nr:sel1 repeat family protein [Opitutales bacterium]
MKIFGELREKNYEPATSMFIVLSDEIKYKKILEKGLKKVERDAENGDPDSMYAIYFAYKNRLAKDMDERAASRYCVRAAEAGHALAQYEAGCMYYYGELGRAKNSKTAAQWFRKAQKGGIIRACGYMGECYLIGGGVVKNQKKALEFFFEGEKRSDSFSLYYLGDMALKGELEGYSKERGLEFLRRGAMMGNRECLSILARHYFDIKDDKEALFWARLAFVFGYKDAKNIALPAHQNICIAKFNAEQKAIGDALQKRIAEGDASAMLEFADFTHDYRVKLKHLINAFHFGESRAAVKILQVLLEEKATKEKLGFSDEKYKQGLVAYYKKAKELGNADAPYYLFEIWDMNGFPFSRDIVGECEW